VDLGENALELLYPRLTGESKLEETLDRLGPQQKDRMAAKSRAATRLFVAEGVAKLAIKNGKEAAVVEQLVKLLAGETGPGAAAAFEFLGKPAAQRASTDLEGVLSPHSPAVAEAAAHALAVVGQASSLSALAELAAQAGQERDAEGALTHAGMASLQALTILLQNAKPSDDKVLRILCDLVGDEPDQPNASKKALPDVLREFACDALGALGDPEALPSLARARRDTKHHVRQAAQSAIRAICGEDSARSRKLAEIFKSEQSRSQDRVGAALAVGDIGHEVRVHDLIARLVDRNPPRDVRDPDPAVRAAVCRALAALKNKTQATIEALLHSMEDAAEEVRQQAYGALRATVGTEVASKIALEVRDVKGPTEFDGSFEKDVRAEFLKRWREWFEQEKKGGLPKAPREET